MRCSWPWMRDLVEGEPGQQRGDQHERGGDDLGRARAGERPEQPAKIAPTRGRKRIA